MQQLGDFFALGQQQAILSGDGFELHCGDHIDNCAYGNGQSAFDHSGHATANRCAQCHIQTLLDAPYHSAHNKRCQHGFSQILQDRRGIGQNSADADEVQHGDAQIAQKTTDGCADDADALISGQDEYGHQLYDTADEHIADRQIHMTVCLHDGIGQQNHSVKQNANAQNHHQFAGQCQLPRLCIVAQQSGDGFRKNRKTHSAGGTDEGGDTSGRFFRSLGTQEILGGQLSGNGRNGADGNGREDGKRFNRHYDITDAGNFEGKNIPNLLKSDTSDKTLEPLLRLLEEYRKKRYSLHRDEKILMSWNSLMIAAMCELYLTAKKEIYLTAAQNADRFIQKHLCENETVYVSYHLEMRGVKGFLDDYAAYIFAQLALYRATLEGVYLERAKRLCDKILLDFGDSSGGFYLYGKDHEELILRPKETYDGAVPSGNSLMAYNLVRLSVITGDERYTREGERQLDFLSKDGSQYLTSHAMFLKALLEHTMPQMTVTVVIDEQTEKNRLPLVLPSGATVILLPKPTKEYQLKNGKTTYYVCRGHRCLPPTNDLNEFI